MNNKNYLVCGVKELDSKYYYLFNPNKTLVYSEKALKGEITKKNLNLINGVVQNNSIMISNPNLSISVSIDEREAFYLELVEDIYALGYFNVGILFKVLNKMSSVLNRLSEQKVMFEVDKIFLRELSLIIKSYFNYLDLEGMDYKNGKIKGNISLGIKEDNNDKYGLMMNIPTVLKRIYDYSINTMEEIDFEFYNDSVFNKWYKEDVMEVASLFEYTCFIKYFEENLNKPFSHENVDKMKASVDILIYLLKRVWYSSIGEFLYAGFIMNLSDVLSDFFNNSREDYKKEKDTVYYVLKRPSITLKGTEQNKKSRKALLDDFVSKLNKDIKERTKRIEDNGKKLNAVMKNYRGSAEEMINLFYNDFDKNKSLDFNKVYSHISNFYIQVDNSVKKLPPKAILSISDGLHSCSLILKDLTGFASVGFKLDGFSFDGTKEAIEDIKENHLEEVKNMYQEYMDKVTKNSLSVESKEIIKKFQNTKEGDRGALFYCLDKHRYKKAHLKYHQSYIYSPLEVQPLLFDTVNNIDNLIPEIEYSWLSAYYWMHEKLNMTYITRIYASDFYVYFFEKTLYSQKLKDKEYISKRLKEFERNLYGSRGFGWQRDKDFNNKVDVRQFVK